MNPTRLKFKVPSPNETEDRFILLEDRGERLLVADASGRFADAGIVPTYVFPAEDLEPSKD
jgi:hypothetical protein